MNFKRFFATATAIILAICTLIFAACGDAGIKTVKVTFDYNDGATPDRVVEIEAGSTVDEPNSPTRDGHIFGGWYLDGEEFDFDTVINKDLTLIAEWEENDHTVTIIFYEGNQIKRVVSDGEKLQRPTVPEREGYTFDNWYTDQTYLKLYNFDSPVKSDLTIYGHWIDNAVTYYDVTYNYNYANSQPVVVPVEENQKAIQPEDPVYAGYKFLGWFTTVDGDIKYDFDTPVTSDIEIFAHWELIVVEGVKNYVFEAELTDLSDFEGTGFSNEAKAGQAIQAASKWSDRVDLQASNGFWVGYMYKNELELKFEFTSDRNVSDATIKIRLSGEIVDRIAINSDIFKIILNDVPINYNEIVISGINKGTSEPPKVFEDYELGVNLSLKEGKNTIVLKVNNKTSPTGTDGVPAGGKIVATAPLIDCIKITTVAVLEWNPWFTGIEKYHDWYHETDYKGILDTSAEG